MYIKGQITYIESIPSTECYMLFGLSEIGCGHVWISLIEVFELLNKKGLVLLCNL